MMLNSEIASRRRRRYLKSAKLNRTKNVIHVLPNYQSFSDFDQLPLFLLIKCLVFV